MSEPTPTHNEFFIEKRRLPVEIELVSGERLDGDLFTQSSWRGPSILEDAPEYMNAAESFFPLQLPDGTTRLIARRHVVVLKAPPPDYRRNQNELGEPVTVCIQMSNGSMIRGTLFVEAMAPKARVLDHLNRCSDSFLVLRDSAGDLVVNRSHVISVVEERDGTD